MTDDMLATNIFFYIFAAIMVGSAIRVVTTKNVVHAALWLIGVLAGAAAQFILLASEFMGVTQVLVYIGAIVVLFLFGIMLTRAELGTSDDLDNDRTQKTVAGVVAVLLAGVMGYVLWDAFRDESFSLASSTTGSLGQTTEQISDSIFSTYLVPFEAASVLLLAALIGAIVLARRD
jgi:NADH-quinone oxidoreductase subunit J